MSKSKDIRSFFTTIKKNTNESSHSKKRPVVIESSDEDEPVSTGEIKVNYHKKRKIDSTKSPKKTSGTENNQKRRPVINSSSDEAECSNIETKRNKNKNSENVKSRKTAQKEATKLKPISALEMFSSTPVRKNQNNENDVFSDDDFKETLKQIDEKLIKFEKNEAHEKSKIENNNKSKISPKIPEKIVTKTPSPSDTSVDVIEETPNRGHKRKTNECDSTLTDEERYDRRRQSAYLYQKYLHRGGPSKPGSKEIPKGKPDCLKGLTFLITGVLESLERDEAAALISSHGGRVVKTVSGKLSYLVLGDDAGPAKVEKAKHFGIKMISEDELLELIRAKSDIPTKLTTNDETTDEEKKTVENLISKPSNSTKQKDQNSKSKTIVDQKVKSKTPSKEEKLKSTKTSPPKKQKLTKQPETTISEQRSEKSTTTTKSDNNENSLAWVDKYKPTTVKQIIGQGGDASCVKKLTRWLQNWYKNRLLKLPKPSPWSKTDDGSYYKAALLSGSPGIGKTTTATLVAKELGFDIVELNASDSRNKKLLHEEVGHLLSNKSLSGYFKGGEPTTKRHVLLMDEVDGMAGNEDRGGMRELIDLIKTSSIPVICMCNDKHHPKMRSLLNYCYDLRFIKPRVEQIRAAMMSVCFKENVKINAATIDKVINASQQDIRQTLNILSLWTSNETNSNVDVGDQAANTIKDIKLGPWDVVRKVFTENEQKNMTIHEKSDLFFNDYSLIPLFVQDNYLNVSPHCNKIEILDHVANAAEYISYGDLVDAKIRSKGAWSLLPTQAIYSSVGPGYEMSGHFVGQINFPDWLGKNSKRSKSFRLLSELQTHMRLSTTAGRQAVNLDYVKYLRDAIIKPLLKPNEPDITKAIDVMDRYNLLREDLDGLIELSLWPRQKNPFDMVNVKTKTAFTRTYNKKIQPYSSGSSKKRADVNEYDALEEHDDGNNDEEEGEEEDNINADGMIKAKKTTAKEKKAASSKTGSSSSNNKKEIKKKNKIK